MTAPEVVTLSIAAAAGDPGQNEWVDTRIHEYTNGWMDGWMDGWMNGWMNG